MLRGYTKEATTDETTDVSKELIWLYVPDFNKYGRIDHIKYIPSLGNNDSDHVFWY